MRVATQNGTLRRALMERMSFKFQHTGRSARDFYTEVVPCFSLKEFEGAQHIIAPAGFLEAVLQIASDFNIPFRVIDLEDNSVIQDPWACSPLRLKIPRREWEQARDWQKQAVRIMNSYVDGRFCVATGGGKSRLIADLCRWLPHDRILITAKSKSLCDDLHSKILESAGNVGIHHSSRRDPYGRILVCSTGSLSHYVDKDWDILIGDEIHELMTKTGLEALAMIKAKRAYGFSGSIGDRQDNADAWGEGFFGPLRMTRTYQDVQSEDSVVPILIDWIELYDCGKLISPFRSSDRKKVFIWRNHVRNEAFAKRARYHYDRGRQVLVMTETTEHALRMAKLLNWPVVAKPPSDSRRKYFIDQGLLQPGQLESDKQSRELQEAFERRKIRGVIANRIWHTGKDFPSLDVLCRMDGGAAEIPSTQIPGRLARKYPGKPFGLLIDSRDYFEPSSERRASRRADSYRSRGWRSATKAEIETWNLTGEEASV